IEQLSSSCRQVPVSPELEAKLSEYAARMGDGPSYRGRISPTERYRRFLSYVREGLRRTRDEGSSPESYRSAGEFHADLQLLYNSLAQNRGEHIATLVLDPLVRKVRTFGFHLTTLDIRQHANVHRQALTAISSSHSSSREAVAVIREPAPDSIANTVLQTLQGIRSWKHEFPSIAIRNYVISGTESEEDIFAVLTLAN